MLSKSKLTFDTTNPSEGDNVGSYLRSSDGTLLTHTLVGGKNALDVNVVAQAGSYAEDSAHASGDMGQFILAVRNDADTSLVGTDGDYAPLQVDADGRLKVAADISVVNGFEKAEDAAHSSGDIGGYVLNVREDSLASSTGASGDYQSFKSDALGRLYVTQAGQTAAYGNVSVANTATDIVGTDLVNRRRILIQNADNKAVFIGSNASVTTSTGIRLDPGSALELEVAAGINVHGIVSSGTADVRYFEIGA